MTACSYDAISWHMTPSGAKARVNPALCKGDGLCCSKCPTDAVVLEHFTNDEVLHQIDAALGDPWGSGSSSTCKEACCAQEDTETKMEVRT